ncbi:AraC family ligand binding domain-containing protein [Streptomyces sp. NPDC050095]|uniref:AraC family ligand binding domain-containing protein n=1 Tax=unclassified Streptomyces TaxID=2593676 RepID=UPI003427329F
MTMIRQMTYRPAERLAATVETMTFDRLRELNDGGTQRADFHVLALVDAGHGLLTVDFRQHPLEERSAVWIPPGAVHQWDDMTEVAGHIALFVPTAPVTRASRELVGYPEPAAHWSIPDADWPFVDAARNHLLLEESASSAGLATERPDILLSVLIARLRPPHSGARFSHPVFWLFRSSVEAHFREHHDAGYY